MSVPVAVLTIVGTVLAFLGLFAAGNLPLIALGVGAVVAAGVLDVAARRAA